MHVIIGGVERKIDRVETYLKTSKKGETLGQILENSRASKLVEKEYRKKMIQDMIDFSQGRTDTISTNGIIRPKNLDMIEGAAEAALSAELSYADQASSFHDQTNKKPQYPDYDFLE